MCNYSSNEFRVLCKKLGRYLKKRYVLTAKGALGYLKGRDGDFPLTFRLEINDYIVERIAGLDKNKKKVYAGDIVLRGGVLYKIYF